MNNNVTLLLCGVAIIMVSRYRKKNVICKKMQIGKAFSVENAILVIINKG